TEPPLRAAPPSRPSFADIPTDPAAPGLLQRMAQVPANDAAAKVTPLKPPAARESELEDDEFGEPSQEYDAGEVTVVADASQLDILRETLGRLDGKPEESERPLTPTMPAPPGPTDSGELEGVTQPGPLDEPDLFAEPPTVASAAKLEVAHDSLPESEAAPLELQTPKLRLSDGESARPKPAPASKTSAWLVVSLLLLAVAAVAALYWARLQ
ncbi:MAG TPA: hypothetical protein VG963_31080, partial [Polyangiaceae bacterium]|nr:hypothetical protein [Polyangiaceae bacterium]